MTEPIGMKAAAEECYEMLKAQGLDVRDFTKVEVDNLIKMLLVVRMYKKLGG